MTDETTGPGDGAMDDGIVDNATLDDATLEDSLGSAPADDPAGGATPTIELAADIVAAYVARNRVPPGDLAGLIHEVHGALRRAASPGEMPAEAPRPAVPVRRSVTPDYIVCLEDGKHFKSLKRHLRTRYDMTPEQYRERWNLPADYPMVAPSYAASRSSLAKQMGLGQQRRRGR